MTRRSHVQHDPFHLSVSARSWTATLFLFLAAACAPSIASLRAEPNQICPGDAVRLSWKASTGGTLSTKTPNQSLGDVSASGTQQVHPSHTTTYRLDVKNVFGKDAREVDVTVNDADTAHIVGESVAAPAVRCANGEVAVTIPTSPTFWGPNLRVGTIALVRGDSRRFHVEHGGRKADLDPNASSSSAAFAGTSASGDWKLATPLPTGDTCGHYSFRNLAVEVTVTCGAPEGGHDAS